MVTIYNGNLGLVKDLREIRLPTGVHEVQFMEVAAQIDPTTVHLRSLTDPAGLRILEQNYEYDLISSQKLLEKYVGRKVRLYGNDGTYHEATLLSTNGPVYDINGQIHLGHYGRVVLPALPDNLVSQPTLKWLLRNPDGSAPAGGGLLSHRRHHLAGGLRDGDQRRATARPTSPAGSRWTTRAGRPSAMPRSSWWRATSTVRRDARREGRMLDIAAKAASPATGQPASSPRGVSSSTTSTRSTAGPTIKDNQTKQLTLMSATDVPVTKELIYYGAQDYYRNAYGMPVSNQKVAACLEIRNTQGEPARLAVAQGQGARLQGGQRRQPAVHRRGLDRPHREGRAGEDQARQRLRRGGRAHAEGLAEDRLCSLYEVEWEISLRNHKTEAQTVT